MNTFFVVGCARSGTSILGELIASHPDINYIFEAHSVWEAGSSGENESHRLTEKNVTKAIKNDVRGWAETQIRDKDTLVEKNPRNILRIPFVQEIFPSAKFVHIVRDGRDVACSMVPGCGGAEWNHLKPPSWQEYFQKYSGALRCAWAWKEIIEIGLKDLQKVDCLQIRYEDLVTSPSALAEKIFNYLNLPLHSKVDEFYDRISNNTSGDYHAKIQYQWYQNNHSVRVGRWRENLTVEEQHQIEEILHPLLVRLGYQE